MTIWEKLKVKYAEKEKQIGPEAMRTYERIIMLEHHRCPVEGSPAVARPPEAGHRAGWLRPEGSAG